MAELQQLSLTARSKPRHWREKAPHGSVCVLSLPLSVKAPNSTRLGHVCFEFCYKQGVMVVKFRSVSSSSHSSKESPGDTVAFGNADHSLHGLGSGLWEFAIIPVKDSCMSCHSFVCLEYF